MGKVDKQKVAVAAQHVMQRPHTEITEVIDKDEDKDLTLTDRLAAVFATLLVCGGTYFAMWLLIEAKAGGTTATVDVRPIGWLWVLTWRLPFLATGITMVAAFFRPGWTYRYFGKVTSVFEKILIYWR